MREFLEGGGVLAGYRSQEENEWITSAGIGIVKLGAGSALTVAGYYMVTNSGPVWGIPYAGVVLGPICTGTGIAMMIGGTVLMTDSIYDIVPNL